LLRLGLEAGGQIKTMSEDQAANVNGRPTQSPLYVPRHDSDTAPAAGSALSATLGLEDVISALRSLQTQFNSLRVAEQILLHIVDAKETIAGLDRRKLGLLDEISRLEQRREVALANAMAAEQAAKVRLEAIEAQIQREEERLNAEKKKLEEDLGYLRNVINKLTLTASELKL
jgi:chromosome segregation ATPase